MIPLNYSYITSGDIDLSAFTLQEITELFFDGTYRENFLETLSKIIEQVGRANWELIVNHHESLV